MAKPREIPAPTTPKATPRSRCQPIAAGGIETTRDFAEFMSALIADVVDGSVTTGVANAACNAGGKMLKAVELQIKYGNGTGTNGHKHLVLASRSK